GTLEVKSPDRRRIRQGQRREVPALSLSRGGASAQSLAKDFDKTFALRSRPAQPNPELQLDGIDLSLSREYGQGADQRRVVVGETGAEHLHDIVFVGSRVTPAECHIDPLGQGGRAEGEDRSSEESRAPRRGRL